MKLIRLLLAPFAILYGLISLIRNELFNVKFFKSYSTSISSIGVGNLSIGGTGKSIVVDYLIFLFQSNYSIAVLSRGYGRKSSGFKIANSSSLAIEIGDEPYQYYKKYPNIKVTVGEDRVRAVKEILKFDPKINLLLLDDIMQHRWISTTHLILTTTYSSPFFNDRIMPLGMLREHPVGKKRAQTILVTKCPKNLSEANKLSFIKKCDLLTSQEIFFTKIGYSNSIQNNLNKLNFDILKKEKIVLVTGIADSKPLVEFLNSKNILFTHMKYKDHFNYDLNAVSKIKREANHSLILTTEKDFGRLSPILKSKKLFYISVSLEFFSFNDKKDFNERIMTSVGKKES